MINNPLEQLSKNTLSNLLKEIEDKLNADVFTYYGEFLDGVDQEVKSMIEDLSKDSNKKDTLYVILTTTGGSLNPVQRMVTILDIFIKK